MPRAFLTGAVEGLVDEVVVGRLAAECNVVVNPIYITNGKQRLVQRLGGFNEAARFSPWIVLIDLDRIECAPSQLRQVLPAKAPEMYLRVAVHAVEAWLLADRHRIAQFLSIPIGRVPGDPEAELDPKQTLVDLAASSRRRAMRDDFVPRPASGRKVGPGYTGRLIEFITDSQGGWRPGEAAERSRSLARCLEILLAA